MVTLSVAVKEDSSRRGAMTVPASHRTIRNSMRPSAGIPQIPALALPCASTLRYENAPCHRNPCWPNRRHRRRQRLSPGIPRQLRATCSCSTPSGNSQTRRTRGLIATTNVLLGIMAAVSVLEALAVVALFVGGFLLYRRMIGVISRIEERHVAPSVARSTLSTGREEASRLACATRRVLKIFRRFSDLIRCGLRRFL